MPISNELPILNQKIRLVPIDSLILKKRIVKEFKGRSLEQLARFIQGLKYVPPVLIDSKNSVLFGTEWILAMQQIGHEQIPSICIDHLNEVERRALPIALHKIAELGTWNKDVLKAEFEEIHLLDPQFDLTLTTFQIPEIDVIMNVPSGISDQDDDVPAPGSNEIPVSRLGDLWELGPHRLLCGSALEAVSFDQLMAGKLARMVFGDPPYNVRASSISGLGRTKHADFKMGSGEFRRPEFIEFLRKSMKHLVRFSMDGSIHFLCMDWRHMAELMEAAEGIYTELKNLCVWAKPNGGMGSFYRSRHELVFIYKSGRASHLNNIDLGRHGRYRTNVWEYAGNNSFHRGRDEELESHPTVKPTQLVADTILDTSKPDDIVLDCFGGSGTTLIAAERTERIGYLMELDPVYVDVTIRRYQKLTGRSAIHMETGLSFAELSALRRDEVIDV